MFLKIVVVVMWSYCWISVTSYRSFNLMRRVQSRLSRCLMLPYNARSEIRLGQSNSNKSLADQLAGIVFDLTIESTNEYLETVNKPSLEWFGDFLSNLPAEDDENFEANVLNKLVDSESSIFEYKMSPATNSDVSMTFTHVIEPSEIAALLLNTKKTVMIEVQSLLRLILKDISNAGTYAQNKYKYGNALNDKPILDPRDQNVKSSTIIAYNKLNILITNMAVNQMKIDLMLQKNNNGLDYLSQVFDKLFEGLQSVDIRGKNSVRQITNPSRQLLNELYEQGYTDLMLQNILPLQIEKLIIKENNDEKINEMKNENGSENKSGITINEGNNNIDNDTDNDIKNNVNLDKIEVTKITKNQILRDKKKAEELEILKVTVDNIITYNIAKNMSSELINSCNKINNLFNELINSKKIIETENFLFIRIKEKANIINLSGSIVSEGTDVRAFTSTKISPSFIIQNVTDNLKEGSSGTLFDENKNENHNDNDVPNIGKEINLNANDDKINDNNIFTNMIKINDIKNNNKNNNNLNNNGINSKNKTNENRTETSVNAGQPYVTPLFDNDNNNDNNDIKNKNSKGVDEDSVTSAINDLLGSIFKGFRGGERGSDSEIDNERNTATEPLGERVKSSTSIMDPPSSGLPPTTERPKEMEDKDDNDSDNIENRNPIDWGDDIAEGDLSAFRDLGPNARIRYISQKVECGQKFLFLEGRSLARDGIPSVVINQWIQYDEAMEFLKNGYDNTDSEDTGSKSTDSMDGNMFQNNQKDEINESNTFVPLEKKEEGSLHDERAQMM